MPVAVISGASQGLGHALAEALAGEGWVVVGDARDEVALTAAMASLPGEGHAALAGDVTDAAHRRRLAEAAERLGGADLLVNNASTLGASPLPAFADLEPAGLPAPARRQRGRTARPGARAPPPAAPSARGGAQHQLGRRRGGLRDLGRVRVLEGRPRPREPGARRRGAGPARVRRRPRRHAHRDAPGRVPRRGHLRPARHRRRSPPGCSTCCTPAVRRAATEQPTWVGPRS